MHRHFSIIVMCVAGSYLPVARVSTPVVSVVLDSICHVLGDTSLVSAMCSSIVAPEDQLSSCGMYSTLFWRLGFSLIVMCWGAPP